MRRARRPTRLLTVQAPKIQPPPKTRRTNVAEKAAEAKTSKRGEDLRAVEQLSKARRVLLREIHKVIVGQDDVIEQLLIAMFCRGHCLIVGVPGLAKTLMVQTISRLFTLEFNRIQFTPDLMPSDITGTEIIEEDLILQPLAL